MAGKDTEGLGLLNGKETENGLGRVVGREAGVLGRKVGREIEEDLERMADGLERMYE